MGVLGPNEAASHSSAVLNEITLRSHDRVSDVSLERHYSTQEAAKIWGVSRQTVTRLFMDEPGVLFIGHGERRNKRAYYTMRIPESVLIRVHRKLRQVN